MQQKIKIMKRKITLTLMCLALVSLMFGQMATKSNSLLQAKKSTKNCKIQQTKTLGDTLMYFDSHGWYVNPTDEANFNYLNEDIDNNVPYNASSWDSDWNFWFTDSSSGAYFQEMKMPWDVDTAYYFAATSWFNPAGQADNWFSFGPITIPDSGAILKWYAKWNPGYRDGYMIKASLTGLSNYSDFADNSYFYKIVDLSPNPNDLTDTLWAPFSVGIPGQFAGQELYVAIHHNANDMDVLWLDELLMVEANNVSIKENETIDAALHQNFPNPVKEITSIPYDINKTSYVSINIMDITGRLVNTIDIGNKTPGKYYINYNVSELAKGTYYYTLNVDNKKITKKMVVVK